MHPRRALACLALLLAASCAATDGPAAHDAAHATHASDDKPGFVTEVVDGRLWVFRADSEALATYRSTGEPAKHVIRPAAGPLGMTVKGPDNETNDAYLRAVKG